MNDETYFIRDYTKTNLVDDLIESFPKLKNPIYIPRSNGTFTKGNIIISNFIKNKYVIFMPKYNSWFIQTYFYDDFLNTISKMISIEELKFSNFSQSEIETINQALNKGIKGNYDFTSISPDFHPINKNINDFEKLFQKKNIDINPGFNPDTFLNLPPLTI